MKSSDEGKEIRVMIRTYLAQEDINASEFAKQLSVSSGYISRVMAGKCPPSDALLSAMGYVRVVRYEPVKNACKPV